MHLHHKRLWSFFCLQNMYKGYSIFCVSHKYETWIEGQEKFQFWLKRNHPKRIVVFLKNFLHSRMDISYDASVPLLLIFDVYLDFLQQTADFSNHKLKKSIFPSCQTVILWVSSYASCFPRQNYQTLSVLDKQYKICAWCERGFNARKHSKKCTSHDSCNSTFTFRSRVWAIWVLGAWGIPYIC